MPRLQTMFRLAFWAALIFAFVMALLPKPPPIPGEPSDKVQHIIAFAVLTVLALAGDPRAARLAQALGLFGLGALIELLQMIPALNRDAQLADWLADSAAVVVVMALAALLRQVTRPRTA